MCRSLLLINVQDAAAETSSIIVTNDRSARTLPQLSVRRRPSRGF